MRKIKEFISGKKVYILMFVGALVAILQFLGGIDFGIQALPPAQSIGDLVSQLWAFAATSGFRAAIAKIGK